MTRSSKKNNLRWQDPFLKREKQNYANPLPSREWIIEILTKTGIPIPKEELIKILSIKKSEVEAFSHRLRAMVRDGQLYINRRGSVCVAEKINLVSCRVEGHAEGFGFAIPLNKTTEKDFFLPEKEMSKVMHGDIVSVQPQRSHSRRGREGRVVEVLEHAQQQCIVRGYWEDGIAIAQPEDKRISQSILLPKAKKNSFKNGQVLMVGIDVFPTNKRPPIGHIIEVLGDYNDSGMEIEIAIRQYHLPYQFNQACLKEANTVPDEVPFADYEHRENLCHLPLITIDGESARDFDDAVYAQKQGRNYRLIVAIADVSHYVELGSELDKEARKRGTSVYFPRRVIPMLPEALSNHICSLNPNQTRLCMVCDMRISYAGNVLGYEFYPAVMRSHARLTYNEVWKQIQSQEDHKFKKEINTLYSLYQTLVKKRHQRGAMEFDTQETQMIFDKDGKIKQIIPLIRNDAHRLIEECMLVANVCAAEFLTKHEQPFLYRIHGSPTPEKIETLRRQLALLGLSLDGGEEPTPKDFAKLTEQIQQRPDANMVQIMLLRTMQQAIYSPDNIGHFGLAYSEYAHFTSPIRRYPDLLVHRAIKAVLQGKQYNEQWASIGIDCSMTERRADEASRDVERWLKTYFMCDKIGEYYTGHITGITNFGIFVTLDDIYIDGMIHISDLGKDYFHYREDILAIEGERTKKRFTLGDEIRVQVAQANLDTRRIDLVLAKD